MCMGKHLKILRGTTIFINVLFMGQACEQSYATQRNPKHRGICSPIGIYCRRSFKRRHLVQMCLPTLHNSGTPSVLSRRGDGVLKPK